MRRTALFSFAAAVVCVSLLLVPPAEGAKVLVEKPAVQPPPGEPVAYQPVDTEVLAGLGATILAEYPFFYLADVPEADLAQFLEAAQARGFAVTARESFDEIRVNGYEFPSAGALPPLPPNLTLAEYAGPLGLLFRDPANNVEMVRIRPGEIAGGSFTLEVQPTAISAKAVPGLDGSAANQDFAVYVYNAL